MARQHYLKTKSHRIPVDEITWRMVHDYPNLKLLGSTLPPASTWIPLSRTAPRATPKPATVRPVPAVNQVSGSARNGSGVAPLKPASNAPTATATRFSELLEATTLGRAIQAHGKPPTLSARERALLSMSSVGAAALRRRAQE